MSRFALSIFPYIPTVTAIKDMGGPTIPWSSGRVDAMDPSAVTPDGRLPNAESGPLGADKSDADHLRDIFYRMGFDDREIVVLSGAHALGRCHRKYNEIVDCVWGYLADDFHNCWSIDSPRAILSTQSCPRFLAAVSQHQLQQLHLGLMVLGLPLQPRSTMLTLLCFRI